MVNKLENNEYQKTKYNGNNKNNVKQKHKNYKDSFIPFVL